MQTLAEKVLTENTLSPTERLVLSWFCLQGGRSGITQAYLGERMGLGRSTVELAFRRLKELQVLTRSRNDEGVFIWQMNQPTQWRLHAR